MKQAFNKSTQMQAAGLWIWKKNKKIRWADALISPKYSATKEILDALYILLDKCTQGKKYSTK